MKALMSPLAKQLLANPRTREQLRRVPNSAGETLVVDDRDGQTRRYIVRVVPKAR